MSSPKKLRDEYDEPPGRVQPKKLPIERDPAGWQDPCVSILPGNDAKRSCPRTDYFRLIQNAGRAPYAVIALSTGLFINVLSYSITKAFNFPASVL